VLFSSPCGPWIAWQNQMSCRPDAADLKVRTTF
jgi:hypothetical protein